MPPVAIVTDSTHYLPRSLADSEGVSQVGLYVGWKEDGGDIGQRRELEMDGFDGFYSRLRSDPELPVTSQPSIGDFLTVWEPPERRDVLVALVRSSMTSDEAARMLREFLGREVFGKVAASTGAQNPQLRGALAASQVIGLIVGRYVIRLPALVDATREQLVEGLGPVLQHHLVDRAANPE